MGIALPELTPAQESLFLTLGSRAIDSRLPRPFLNDTLADELITATGYDLRRFPALSTTVMDRRSMVFDVAVRAKIIDAAVRRFVGREPDAVVLDLGAGLDDRMRRVNPPPTVGWYNVDFPEVISLRRQLLPPGRNAHEIAADLTDPDWLREVPAQRPAMIVADGLQLFLAQDDLVSLLRRLVAHFPAGEVALNVYTSHAVRAFKRARAMRVIAPDITNPGLDDPARLETCVDGLTLVEEIFLTRAHEVAELPRLRRWASRSVARSPKLSRIMSSVVLRYSL